MQVGVGVQRVWPRGEDNAKPALGRSVSNVEWGRRLHTKKFDLSRGLQIPSKECGIFEDQSWLCVAPEKIHTICWKFRPHLEWCVAKKGSFFNPADPRGNK